MNSPQRKLLVSDGTSPILQQVTPMFKAHPNGAAFSL